MPTLPQKKPDLKDSDPITAKFMITSLIVFLISLITVFLLVYFCIFMFNIKSHFLFKILILLSMVSVIKLMIWIMNILIKKDFFKK